MCEGLMKANARMSAYIGASLIALVLAFATALFVCSGAIIDSYGKRKIEQAFALAHPGSVLRIGRLEYSSESNRMAAQSVTPPQFLDATLKLGRDFANWSSLGQPSLGSCPTDQCPCERESGRDEYRSRISRRAL